MRHDDGHSPFERPPQQKRISKGLTILRVDRLLLSRMGEQDHPMPHHRRIEGVDALIRWIDAHGVGQPLHQPDAPLRPLLELPQRIAAVGMHRNHRHEPRRVFPGDSIDDVVRHEEWGALQIDRPVFAIVLVEGHDRVPAPRDVPNQRAEPRQVLSIGLAVVFDPRGAFID